MEKKALDFDYLNTEEERETMLDYKLESFIDTLNIFIGSYGLIEGCLDTKDLVFYFIYTNQFRVSLLGYTIA